MTILLLHGVPEWGPAFKDVPKPGLVLVPTNDPYQFAEGARAGAAQAGASVVVLEGTGHWWMLEDPEGSAEMLRRFWAEIA